MNEPNQAVPLGPEPIVQQIRAFTEYLDRPNRPPPPCPFLPNAIVGSGEIRAFMANLASDDLTSWLQLLAGMIGEPEKERHLRAIQDASPYVEKTLFKVVTSNGGIEIKAGGIKETLVELVSKLPNGTHVLMMDRIQRGDLTIRSI